MLSLGKGLKLREVEGVDVFTRNNKTWWTCASFDKGVEVPLGKLVGYKRASTFNAMNRRGINLHKSLCGLSLYLYKHFYVIVSIYKEKESLIR